jgi:hypothetical protein
MPISLPPIVRFSLYTPPALAIASGVLNASKAYHTIDTEAGAASDNLDTLNGLAVDGMVVALRTLTPEHVVVLKHNTGNLYLPAETDITMDASTRAVLLAYNASLGKWQHANEAGYLLLDAFTDIRAAGAVHGTPATPGPGTRTVTDTESKLSITGGQLSFAGGKASPVGGDPGIWYPAISRVAGRMILASYQGTAEKYFVGIGFDSNQTGSIAESISRSYSYLGFNISSMILNVYPWSVNSFRFCVILRTPGFFVFGNENSGGWYLWWIHSAGTTTPVYPGIAGYNDVVTVDNLRIPARLWLPTPLAYTVFDAAAGELNGTQTDATGPDSQTTPQRTWASSAGVWALDGAGKVAGTPALGSEVIANPGFEGTYVGGLAPNWTKLGTPTIAESADAHGGSAAQQISSGDGTSSHSVAQIGLATAGVWYQFSCYVKRVAGSNCGSYVFGSWPISTTSATYVQLFGTKRATAAHGVYCLVSDSTTTCNFDDASLKALTLSSLFASVTDAITSDVIVDAVITTLVAHTQAGVAARLDSQSAPTKGIVAYFDGGNIKVDEFTAATTWTNLISVAKAFTAGDTLRLDLSGNNIRCYHITVAGVATLIGTATATANTNTKHGLFSTYSGNTFDAFTIWPKGTGNEYAALDTM